MRKNEAGKWVVFAFEDQGGTSPGEPVTSDAAQITANVRIDGAAAAEIADTNPAELEDGYYIFDLTAAETNGDLLLIAPQSSTDNVNVIGVPGAVWTRTAMATVGDINSNHTWTLTATEDGNKSQNIISIDVGEIYTLSMDFSKILNPGTGISSVDTVAISGTSLVTTADLAASQDIKKAYAAYTATSATIGEYLVTITITSSDGNTVKGIGWLHVT